MMVVWCSKLTMISSDIKTGDQGVPMKNMT
jgi:hypothetical protein